MGRPSFERWLRLARDGAAADVPPASRAAARRSPAPSRAFGRSCPGSPVHRRPWLATPHPPLGARELSLSPARVWRGARRAATGVAAGVAGGRSGPRGPSGGRGGSLASSPAARAPAAPAGAPSACGCGVSPTRRPAEADPGAVCRRERRAPTAPQRRGLPESAPEVGDVLSITPPPWRVPVRRAQRWGARRASGTARDSEAMVDGNG